MTRGEPIKVTSTSNSAIRFAQTLKKRRNRRQEGKFRIEGHREIGEALNADISIDAAFYCPEISRFGLARSTLQRIESGTSAVLYETALGVFHSLSQWENPDGLLVIAKQELGKSDFRIKGEDSVYLVVDGVEKPGNLGAMFRSVDASGCSGILISDPEIDLFNPNVIRASLGTVFTTPSVIGSAPEIMALLKEAGIRLVGTSPSATQKYHASNLHQNCAVLIGRESQGLTQEWLDVCDEIVQLPSHGNADSLNAAMAATVMLFEAERQRTTKEKTP